MTNDARRPLRIAALVKQVPAIEAMALAADGRLQREGLKLHMNDYCRRAVSQGHALARQSGGTLTVITMGPPSAENVLREAIAFGADEGILVSDPALTASDTLATATALAAAVRREGPFDLILLGRNSVDADTGQVPPQLAALLELPFAAGVRELDLDGELLHLWLEHDDERVQVELELPAMLSCAERLCDPCKIKDPDVWATVDSARIRQLRADDLGQGPWGLSASPTSVGATRALGVSREQYRVDPGPVTEQVATVLRVLDKRGALGDSTDGFEAASGTVPDNRTNGDGSEVVVVVEPGRATLTRELLGAAAHLATAISGSVVAVGADPGEPAQLSAWGADAVCIADGSESEQDLAQALTDRFRQRPPWAVLGPSTAWGRDVLSRIAVALQAGLTGDAVGLRVQEGRLVADKPAFGGQLVAEIHCASPVQMASVRAGVLPRLEPRATIPIPVLTLPTRSDSRVRVLGRHREDDLDDLTTAEVVIGVGTGVSPEDYPLLRQLADQLGAALCATRKVTDRGWMPRARQVGITGHVIAPRLFVSIGASGKFNHTIGVRAAGTIVAVNSDPSAPIFDFADVGVVGDWKSVMPELAAAIATARQAA